MNMKAIMKLQKDMMKAKEELDSMEFESKNSFVTVKGNGKKEITSVKIESESLDKDDIEMLEDIILVAVNDINKQVDKMTEQKMGKFTQGMPGLF